MNDRRKSQLLGAAIGFLAAFGGVGVLKTGLFFDGVSPLVLMLFCAVAATVFAVCLGFRGFPAVPCLLALVCGLLWRTGSLNVSVEALLHHVSLLYNKGYGWPVVKWSELPLTNTDATLALCLIGAWVAMGVTWAVVRNKGTFFGVLVAFLPLVPCIVLTDTVPAPVFLYLQMLSILLLLLPGMVRSRDLHQGNVLTKFLALPLALALGLLFLLMPREGYTGKEAAEKMGSFLQQLFPEAEMPQLEIPVTEPPEAEAPSDRVNLTTVGPKRPWEIPVMDILAEESGTVYLRSTVYDTYRGTYWDVDTADKQPMAFPLDAPSHRLTITTRSSHEVLYMPYVADLVMAEDGTVHENIIGRVENPEGLTAYTVVYHKPYTHLQIQNEVRLNQDRTYLVLEDGTVLIGMGGSVRLDIPEKYKHLDTDTRAGAEEILQNIPRTTDPWILATSIRDYVSASAEYDLQTTKMPAGEDDFALWFLRESETGYCVHFASATVVLLRAAGIPARYVTGYLVSTQAGETVTVMQKNAHAWVECYIEGVGWVVLEPTPGGGLAQTAGDEATAPTETTEETEPGQTEETTLPENQTTAPEDTQKPSKPTTPTQGGENASEEEELLLKEPFVMPDWLKWVLWILGGLLVAMGQWRLRVYIRRRKRRTGRANAQALARWQEVVLHAKVRRIRPEENLHSLAQKAKFSQYTLTREELAAFDTWLKGSQESMRSLPLTRRFLATFILALY